MRNELHRKYLLSTILLIFMCVATTQAQPEKASVVAEATDKPPVSLSIRSSNENIRLGETLRLSLDLRNHGAKPINVLDAFATGTGMIKIFSSLDGKEYVNSSNWGWGTLDVLGGTVIRPNSSISTSADVLWTIDKDWKPQFRFREPGRYDVKATYRLYVGDENGLPFLRSKDGEAAWTLIESEPVRVIITEPSGPDREVWEKFNSNGLFAPFLDRSDVRISADKPTDRTNFLEQVSQIIAEHPDSIYAEPLRRSVEKYNEIEKKIKDIKMNAQGGRP